MMKECYQILKTEISIRVNNYLIRAKYNYTTEYTILHC